MKKLVAGDRVYHKNHKVYGTIAENCHQSGDPNSIFGSVMVHFDQDLPSFGNFAEVSVNMLDFISEINGWSNEETYDVVVTLRANRNVNKKYLSLLKSGMQKYEYDWHYREFPKLEDVLPILEQIPEIVISDKINLDEILEIMVQDTLA